MTLDKLLKDNAAWFEQAVKRRVFDKVDAAALALPEALRQRRIADLKARIDALSQRKANASASYDRAIALEQAELDSLLAEKPLRPPLRTVEAVAGGKRVKKKK